MPSALAWLGRYRLRRKLDLADASAQCSAWAAFEGELRPGSAGAVVWMPGVGLVAARAVMRAPDVLLSPRCVCCVAVRACCPLPGPWWQDPRLPGLGLRGLFDAQQLPPPPGGAGGSRKQQAAGMSVVDEDVFRRWRYQHGIAEGDSDIPPGEGMC